MARDDRYNAPIRFSLGSHTTGRMNGAWWPQDDGLIARELSPLLEQLSKQIGAVTEVTLNWNTGSPRSTMRSAIMPQHLASQPFHWVITVHGDRRVVRMLLVPARTNRRLATAIMRLAAQMPLVDCGETDDATAALRIIMAA